MLRLGMGGAIFLFPLLAFMACIKTLPFFKYEYDTFKVYK
jgi:hypothetical protein